MKPEKGNALFLILIAVALFAALSYAVTNSGRGGGGIDREQAEILAAEILQYSALLQAEVQKKMIIGGYSAEELDFGSDVYNRWQSSPSPWHDNPNCTSDDCRIFQSNGGEVSERIFSDASINYTSPYSSVHPHPGHPFAARGDIIDIGTSRQDLYWGVAGLKKEVCNAINSKLGLPYKNYIDEGFGTWGQIGGHDLSTANYWSLDETSVNQIGDQETALQGKHTGCFAGSAYGYIFYSVLVPR